MPNIITTLAQRQKDALARIDAANMEAVSRAYYATYGNLEAEIDALTLAMDEDMTAADVKSLPQYKRLIREAERELDKFTGYLETTISAVALAGIGYGLADSAALIAALSGSPYAGLQPSVVRPLLSYLNKNSPLYARLKLITGSTVEKVTSAILDGVLKGFNPRKIASFIQDAFANGLTDALRNVRTVQIKSYQDAARANYMSTDGIVTGWVWFAELDADVCMSCVSMHGTIHELDETLDDHYNGRCAALPYIPEFGNPVEQTGQAWFDSLPEAQQVAMMGRAKHEAYKSDLFAFDALSNKQDHDIFGTMRFETSLKDLLGE